MPISVSMIVLSSQLVVAVADQVPKFDIARGCKLDNAAMAGVSVAQPLNRCVSDEQKAQQQLGSEWSTYSASSRKSCSRMENVGDTHSYVSLLACLQMYNPPK